MKTDGTFKILLKGKDMPNGRETQVLFDGEEMHPREIFIFMDPQSKMRIAFQFYNRKTDEEFLTHGLVRGTHENEIYGELIESPNGWTIPRTLPDEPPEARPVES